MLKKDGKGAFRDGTKTDNQDFILELHDPFLFSKSISQVFTNTNPPQKILDKFGRGGYNSGAVFRHKFGDVAKSGLTRQIVDLKIAGSNPVVPAI